MRKNKKKWIKLSPQAAEAIEKLRQAFIDKFGREPGPEDPVLFDPDADEPQPLPAEKVVAQTVEAMTAAKVDPRIIWAFTRTGLMVTEQDLPLLDPDDLEDWVAALREYDEAEQHRRQ